MGSTRTSPAKGHPALPRPLPERRASASTAAARSGSGFPSSSCRSEADCAIGSRARRLAARKASSSSRLASAIWPVCWRWLSTRVRLNCSSAIHWLVSRGTSPTPRKVRVRRRVIESWVGFRRSRSSRGAEVMGGPPPAAQGNADPIPAGDGRPGGSSGRLGPSSEFASHRRASNGSVQPT